MLGAGAGVGQDEMTYSASKRGSGQVGDTGVWPDLVDALFGDVSGSLPGPPLPNSARDTLAEDCNKALQGMALQGMDGAVSVVGQVTVRYSQASSMLLRPANCVQLCNGTYVQLLVPLVVGVSSSIKFVVLEFVDADQMCPNQAEIGLPWLQRSTDMVVVDASDILHRVHVVPYFGTDSDQGSGRTYLVNKGYWRTRGTASSGADEDDERPDEAVYSVCPNSECVGRVKGPPKDGPHVEVECAKCGHSFRWG